MMVSSGRADSLGPNEALESFYALDLGLYEIHTDFI